MKDKILKFHKENGLSITILYSCAFAMAILGIIILLLFICFLWQEYSVFGSGKILMAETGQVGDFIGGLVGTLWAFSGILLYFVAISLQRKDTNSYEKEASISRITDLIFNQYSIIKDSERTLHINISHKSEDIAPVFFQYVQKTFGIPLNSHTEIPLDQINHEMINFSNSNSFHNYRKTITGSLKIILYIINQSRNLNNGLNREEEKNLLFLLNSNLNLLEIEGMFDADLVLNKYLKANFTNQPHPLLSLEKKRFLQTKKF